MSRLRNSWTKRCPTMPWPTTTTVLRPALVSLLTSSLPMPCCEGFVPGSVPGRSCDRRCGRAVDDRVAPDGVHRVARDGVHCVARDGVHRVARDGVHCVARDGA